MCIRDRFTSVKTQAQLASTSPILPPAPGAWNWDNYAEVLGAKLLPVAVKNTAVILVVSIFFNVLLGSVTAYCLQRFEFRFRRLVMGCFYLGMLVPTFVVEIARFKVIQSMGLYNTPVSYTHLRAACPQSFFSRAFAAAAGYGKITAGRF